MRRYMSHDGHSHVTVEELSLEHFALSENGGWAGVHSESGVWSTLFAVLLWGVLFAHVPEVFRSPFQSGPLDLGTDAFAPARANLLQQALARLRRGEALEMLEATWNEHRGRPCSPCTLHRYLLMLELVLLTTVSVCRALGAGCELGPLWG